jgi:hypothetical protein
VTYQVAAHTPAALAFADLATHIFLQALEAAHRYDEQRREIITMILRHALRDRADRGSTKDGPPPDGPIPKPGQRTRCEAARHVEDRAVDLMMALACEFRQLVRGWVQFCRGYGVPPFVYWGTMTGYHRIRETLRESNRKSYSPLGHQRWLNRRRPADGASFDSPVCTPEHFLRQIEACHRQLATHYGVAGNDQKS